MSHYKVYNSCLQLNCLNNILVSDSCVILCGGYLMMKVVMEKLLGGHGHRLALWDDWVGCGVVLRIAI